MFSATAFVESVQLICYWCFIISFNQECEVSVNPKISGEMLWQIATLKFIFKKVPVIVFHEPIQLSILEFKNNYSLRVINPL